MKKIYYCLLVGIASLAITSCLKQDPNLDPDESSSIIEIYNSVPLPTTSAATAIYPVYTQAFDIAPERNFDLQVNYAGAGTAPEDITVTLALDTAVLGQYNREAGTSYVIAPATVYSVSGWTVTIPKGQKVATIPVIFKTDKFNPSLTYGFPVKIQSVSSGKVSSNFGAVIFAVSAKNKYDGIYKAKGYGTLGSNTSAPFLFSVDCSWELNLITAGADAVYMDAQPLFKNGGILYYSGIYPKLVFDLSTDKIIAMKSDAPGNTIAMNFPVDGGTYNSRYDASSQTIYVSYGLNNNATWRVIDTLTYCGPR